MSGLAGRQGRKELPICLSRISPSWCHVPLRKPDFGDMSSVSSKSFYFSLKGCFPLDTSTLDWWWYPEAVTRCFCFGLSLPSEITELIRRIWDSFLTFWQWFTITPPPKLHIPPKPNLCSPEIGHRLPPRQQALLASSAGVTCGEMQRAARALGEQDQPPREAGCENAPHDTCQMGAQAWWGENSVCEGEKRERCKLAPSVHRFSAGWLGWFIMVYRALSPLCWLVSVLPRGRPTGL